MVLYPNWCMLCKENEETANQLFIHCNFSMGVWAYFLSNHNRYWVMPKEMVELFFQWNVSGLGEREKNF